MRNIAVTGETVKLISTPLTLLFNPIRYVIPCQHLFQGLFHITLRETLRSKHGRVQSEGNLDWGKRWQRWVKIVKDLLWAVTTLTGGCWHIYGNNKSGSEHLFKMTDLVCLWWCFRVERKSKSCPCFRSITHFTKEKESQPWSEANSRQECTISSEEPFVQAVLSNHHHVS